MEGGGTPGRGGLRETSSRIRGSEFDPTPIPLPAGVRDRFTTRVAHWVSGDRARRDALLPGLRTDIQLLAEAGAQARLAEALRVVEAQMVEEGGGHGEGPEVDSGPPALLKLLRGAMNSGDELSVSAVRFRRPR